jgi:hypothetical protein
MRRPTRCLESRKYKLFVVLPLLFASAATPHEVDRVCRNGNCDVLTVQQGVVRLVDPLRALDLGRYLPAAQHFVPRDEAPIRNLLSPRQWRIVISAFLDHTINSEAGLRLRFFGSDGGLRATDDVLMAIEQVEEGRLFGGDDEIFGIQSNEEHSTTPGRIFGFYQSMAPRNT